MSEVKAKIIVDNDKEKKEGILTEDSLENLVAQLGTEGDKRSHGTFVNRKRLSAQGNEQELEALYRTEWAAGKVVDIIPNDMTREWRSFDGDIDPEQVEELEDEEKRLNLSGNFNEAHKWGRLYGTSLIIMNIDDGQTPDKPLDIENIKQDGLKHIKAIDRTRLDPDTISVVTNPLEINYGMPEYYRFVDSNNFKIHCSRVLRFDGVKLPYNEFKTNNYFSDSVLDRLYDDLMNLAIVTEGSASMVYESNVDIVKVKNLMTYLQTGEGESTLRKRFALANLLKSFSNTLLLDNEEDFNTKTNTFSGLPDLLDRYLQIVSAASDIPATRLLGNSASGLNATGEGDMKNYYDMIRSRQTNEYGPLLNYFDLIMSKSLGLSEEADLNYKFNSLFQETKKEKSDREFVDAQRDQIYLQNGVITEDIVAKDLKQNDVYTNITDEYIKELEEGFNEDYNELDRSAEENTEENTSISGSTEETEEENSEGNNSTEES